MINYADQDLQVQLDKDLEKFYNKERYRITVCKAMYNPHNECKKYGEKLKGLATYVGLEQLKRGFISG